MRKLVSIITLCFMIIAVFSGCGMLQKLGFGGNNNDELTPASSIVISEEESKKLTDKVPIHLYFASEDGTKLKMEVRYIPITEAKKSLNNLAGIIVKELIKGPSSNSSLKPVIPPTAQLRSPISINGGVATVDFTKDFVDKHPGGKAEEQLTIYSVVNSLTELKEVQKVKFTINGKVQKEYKGSFQFDAPFPRSTAIISKTPSVSTTEKAQKAPEATPSGTKTNDKTKKSEPAKQNGKAATPTPKPSDNKSSDASQTFNSGEEDSEETYLEVLE